MVDRNVTPQADIDWNALPPDEFADQMLALLKEDGPRLTTGQVDQIERYWEADRAVRRGTLVTLTKPGQWLLDKVAEDRDFAVALSAFEQALDHRPYRETLGLIEAAKARIVVALCTREDMQAVTDEAARQINEAE